MNLSSKIVPVGRYRELYPVGTGTIMTPATTGNDPNTGNRKFFDKIFLYHKAKGCVADPKQNNLVTEILLRYRR